MEFLGVPIEVGADGRWYVKTETLYPIMIAYVQEAIAKSDYPPELIETESDSPRQRGTELLRSARSITPQGWLDALKHRQEFAAIPYDLPPAVAEFLTEESQAQLAVIQQRALALNICLGWFQIGLRVTQGSFRLVITTEQDHLPNAINAAPGETIKNPHYRL